METEITLFYEEDQIAKAVAEAVSPDNLKVPTGLYIKTEKRNKSVWTRIKCKKGFKTFIATIDDLLFALSIAEKTIKTARKLE